MQLDERLSWVDALQWFGGSGAAQFLVSPTTDTSVWHLSYEKLGLQFLQRSVYTTNRENCTNLLVMKLAYRLVLIASSTRSQSVSAVRGFFYIRPS